MYWKILILAFLLGTGPEPNQIEPQPEDTAETFIPSEKLPADAAVAFPVDI